MRGKLGLIAVLVLALNGCTTRIAAPIHDDSSAFGTSTRFYRVLPGDTLYSVAFETGHDYRELARWNHIAPPYRIVVGEKIRLTPGLGYRSPRRHQPSASKPIMGRPLIEQSRLYGRPLGASVAPPRSGKMPGKLGSTLLGPVRSWIWPARGRIHAAFERGSAGGARPGNKGIKILGRYGEPIYAAAAGQVVYVGSGLPGYGKLIIIKHNNAYLSAYAHNAQTRVKEGAMVYQGETIATMGDSGTDRVELDFEIRKHGVAVNPMHYLPHSSH